MLHRFPSDVELPAPPARFTWPFRYTPHPLCVIAAGEVQRYLANQKAWRDELAAGKMFGVLVVRDAGGGLGFCAAFSGNLAGSNRHDYFVPPIYDMLRPDGFFRHGEAEISALNARISAMENDAALCALRERIAAAERETELENAADREALKTAKAARDRRRAAGADPETLMRESSFERAECRRRRLRREERLRALRDEAERAGAAIDALKAERRRLSAELQRRLFGEFRVLDARGEAKDLCELFASTLPGMPPAGAGECAAPKLLQYAYLQGLHPLAMAEFWWGASPRTELRRHGYYYPACAGKCGPILRHMLQGLDVEEPPREEPPAAPSVVWEDGRLAVVAKPAGMLSVPGRSAAPSVREWAHERWPGASGPLVVHRLDMATSGLMLVAKDLAAYNDLQAQFRSRTIGKEYVAWLDGRVAGESGRIGLPLCPDPHDRPRQQVHALYGRPAETEYRVLERRGGRTLVAFRPLTGRTHQLRVHAAHPEGLDAPIVGDELYGRRDVRLMLHAARLSFRHPSTGERMTFELPAEFDRKQEL